MPITYNDTPDSLEASNFLTKPGWYHFQVTHIDDAPVSDGKVEQSLMIECRVLAGTESSEVDKDWKKWLKNPTGDGTNVDRLHMKIHLRLARALGLLTNYQPGKPVTIDWSQGKGRQFVAQMTPWTNDAGVTRLQIDGAQIYHCMDGEVRDIPKNATFLKYLEGQPVPPPTSRAGSSAPPPRAQASQQAAAAPPPAAPQAPVSFNDI